MNSCSAIKELSDKVGLNQVMPWIVRGISLWVNSYLIFVFPCKLLTLLFPFKIPVIMLIKCYHYFHLTWVQSFLISELVEMVQSSHRLQRLFPSMMETTRVTGNSWEGQHLLVRFLPSHGQGRDVKPEVLREAVTCAISRHESWHSHFILLSPLPQHNTLTLPHPRALQ